MLRCLNERGVMAPFLLIFITFFWCMPLQAEHVFPPNTVYDVCFTPTMACEKRIIKHIDVAKKSIDAQIFSFTSRNIANALMRAYDRGVRIRILYDASNFDRKVYSLSKNLIRHGIGCHIDDSNIRIAHNKVLIIDGEWVVMGSYNFTYAAEHRNAENVLMIRSDELARSYEQNFLNRLQQSRSCPS